MKIQNISAVMITRDSADTIEQCLQALVVFDEVVVCDTGSADDTIARVRAFANARVFEIDFAGFGDAKRAAVNKASSDWVFSIDSDEIVDAALIHALASWDTDGDQNRLGVIDRRNFFIGRHIRYGGLGRDHIPRLFHRQTHEFSTAKVHEGIVIGRHSRKIRLAGGIDHFTAPDINSRINKMRDYSELAAPTVRVFHPLVVMLRVLYTFTKSYLLQLGFIAGWRGLVIAWCAASGVFFKYMKGYALQKIEQEKIQKQRQHKNQYLKQIFRRSSEIATHRSWRQVAVWMRKHHSDDLIAFLCNPDEIMKNSEMLKDGASTTVVRAKFEGGGSVVIKRHNIKTIFRGLRRCLVTSKGHVHWHNAHLLKISGIATPQPIAFVEQRFGPFRLRSYYVCAFSNFPMLAEKYQSQLPTEQEITWVKDLFIKMRRIPLYHRDPNRYNFLVTDKGIMLIDLDSITDYSSKKIKIRFPYRYRKMLRRFLHEWRNDPRQLKCFTQALEAVDVETK